MTNLDKIRALVKAAIHNKSVTICSEYPVHPSKNSINIPLSNCNIDLSVTLQIKNIGVQFTKIDINTKEKYTSKSLDNNLLDSIRAVYLITIIFSYEPGFEGHYLVLDNIYIGQLKELSKCRYSVHISDVVEINKKAYF